MLLECMKMPEECRYIHVVQVFMKPMASYSEFLCLLYISSSTKLQPQEFTQNSITRYLQSDWLWQISAGGWDSGQECPDVFFLHLLRPLIIQRTCAWFTRLNMYPLFNVFSNIMTTFGENVSMRPCKLHTILSTKTPVVQPFVSACSAYH